jgi:hypothetical protein
VGKEISYCQVCGRRLGVGEALENQVYVHEGRRYCSSCRPERASAKIPLPERRTSTTKMRSQPPAARVKETTRVRKRNGPAFAIAAGLAVASAIGIAIAAGSRAPEPPAAAPKPAGEAVAPAVAPAPKPGAEPALDDLLARVRELQQSDLMFERRDEVRRLLADASVKAGPRLEEVDQLSADYDRRFEEAAARLADFTRSEASRMATKQKFAEAIERLDGFPAAFRTSRAAGILQRLREDYERRRSASGAPPASTDTSPRRVL